MQLDVLQGGHVVGFFEAKQDQWKASTEKTYFSSFQLLFAHHETDRIIERSPFVGADRPKGPTTDSEEQKLAKLKEFLRELDGFEEGSELYRPGMVAMFPIFFDNMDEMRIAAVTGIPLEEVKTYTGQLRANGLWTEDGKIVIDSDNQTVSEFGVNMVLMIGCAAGMIQRVPADEELKTPAPTAEPNGSK